VIKQFQNNPKYIIEPYLIVQPYVIFMNYKEARWKDQRVRQALALAIDTDVMLKLISDGNGLWRGIVSNQHGGWVLPQDQLKSQKYYLRQDLQQAKQLMSAAGNPEISSGLLYNTSYPQPYQDATQYLAQTLTKNGIVKINLVGQDQATM